VRYDNLAAAVKAVLRGRRREESDRFVALRSHYRFDSAFTLAGLEGAHEKGGVEGEVGRYRRRHLVLVPEVDTLACLNARLREACERDLDRRVAWARTSQAVRSSTSVFAQPGARAPLAHVRRRIPRVGQPAL
jgi:hypothetical protein